ncbi:hypothetical protein ACFL6F_02870 [Planctomycetota bacterium]
MKYITITMLICFVIFVSCSSGKVKPEAVKHSSEKKKPYTRPPHTTIKKTIEGNVITLTQDNNQEKIQVKGNDCIFALNLTCKADADSNNYFLNVSYLGKDVMDVEAIKFTLDRKYQKLTWDILDKEMGTERTLHGPFFNESVTVKLDETILKQIINANNVSIVFCGSNNRFSHTIKNPKKMQWGFIEFYNYVKKSKASEAGNIGSEVQRFKVQRFKE